MDKKKLTIGFIILMVAVMGAEIYFGIIKRNQPASAPVPAGPTGPIGPDGKRTPANPLPPPPKIPLPQVSGQQTIKTTLTYSQMVAQYQNKKIDFGENCKITPSSTTFKNKTQILLNNTSSVSQKVTVGKTSYTIPSHSYNFQILYVATVPGNLTASCGTNSVTLKIQ